VTDDQEEQLTSSEKEEIESLRSFLLEGHGNQDENGQWDYFGDLINELADKDDLDRLRVYEKFLPLTEVTVIHLDAIVDFYRRNGKTNVSSFLTREHVIALRTLGYVMMLKAPIESPVTLLPATADPLAHVLLDNLHRRREVLDIIDQRKILDGNVLEELLREMDEQHAALATGLL
jgi:hypothetical protein